MTGKTFSTLALILSIVMVIFNVISPSIRLFNQHSSFYLSDLNFIHCKDNVACRHEVGHLMDDDLGDPSTTEKFGAAVSLYLYYQVKYDETDAITDAIFGTGGIFYYSKEYKPFNSEAGSSPQQELYANIYLAVNGDVSKLPPVFREFYSDSDQYNKIYKDLIVTHNYSKGETQMKEMLAKLVEKAKANKELLIKVGAVVAGALVGAVVATAISNAQNELSFDEEMLLEDETTEETDEETEEE